MRFCSLGSGSAGNAFVVEQGHTTLLIDCGFSFVEIKKRLAARFVDIAEIDAVLISHEHGDHTRGLSALRKKNTTKPIYMTAGTARKMAYPGAWRRLDSGRTLTIGNLTVNPVTVPHNAAEPVQFIIDDGARRLGIFTDLGHISPAVRTACHDLHAIIIECNYDEKMLAANQKYPPAVKESIAGRWGHLENKVAAAFVAELSHRRLSHIMAAHLSANNNTAAEVRTALATISSQAQIHVAEQITGTKWLSIDG